MVDRRDITKRGIISHTKSATTDGIKIIDWDRLGVTVKFINLALQSNMLVGCH